MDGGGVKKIEEDSGEEDASVSWMSEVRGMGEGDQPADVFDQLEMNIIRKNFSAAFELFLGLEPEEYLHDFELFIKRVKVKQILVEEWGKQLLLQTDESQLQKYLGNIIKLGETQKALKACLLWFSRRLPTKDPQEFLQQILKCQGFIHQTFSKLEGFNYVVHFSDWVVGEFRGFLGRCLEEREAASEFLDEVELELLKLTRKGLCLDFVVREVGYKFRLNRG